MIVLTTTTNTYNVTYTRNISPPCFFVLFFYCEQCLLWNPVRLLYEFHNHNYFAYWNLQFITIFPARRFPPVAKPIGCCYSDRWKWNICLHMGYYLNWYTANTQNASLVTLIVHLFASLKYAYVWLQRCSNKYHNIFSTVHNFNSVVHSDGDSVVLALRFKIYSAILLCTG